MTGKDSSAPKATARGKATRIAVAVESKFDFFVFVNCPFDDDYLPLIHAMLFAIHDCGFIARTALEDSGAAEQRIEKICRLIRESRFSIHDISRIELSNSLYPRFNMPFEAGLAYGAIQFGHVKERDMLVLESVSFQGQITLSDLAGTDPKVHNNDPTQMIAAVRAFLAIKKKSGDRTRGATAITERYATFNSQLPVIAHALEISTAEILSLEYLNDWLVLMSVWVLDH